MRNIFKKRFLLGGALIETVAGFAILFSFICAMIGLTGYLGEQNKINSLLEDNLRLTKENFAIEKTLFTADGGFDEATLRRALMDQLAGLNEGLKTFVQGKAALIGGYLLLEIDPESGEAVNLDYKKPILINASSDISWESLPDSARRDFDLSKAFSEAAKKLVFPSPSADKGLGVLGDNFFPQVALVGYAVAISIKESGFAGLIGSYFGNREFMGAVNLAPLSFNY